MESVLRRAAFQSTRAVLLNSTQRAWAPRKIQFSFRTCAQVGEVQVAIRPSNATLFRHFITCAVPMVGFGLMDNTILIRAGDAIDRVLADRFSLTGLECAACGQVVSDFSGVVFGGVIEQVSSFFIVKPSLTYTQHGLRITRLVGIAGAAVGVIVGCILGMGNLLLMDLRNAERLKQLAEMQRLFQKVLKSSLKAFKAMEGTIYVVDHENRALRIFDSTGLANDVIVPLTEHSLAGWVAVNNKPLRLSDAYEDPRFNDAMDKKFGFRTRSVMTTPVRSQNDGSKIIAVIQLINKDPGFTADDESMATMVAEHTSIILTELLEKIA